MCAEPGCTKPSLFEVDGDYCPDHWAARCNCGIGIPGFDQVEHDKLHASVGDKVNHG